jgi:hypothetical protein
MKRHADESSNFLRFKDGKPYFEDRYAIYEVGDDPSEENTSDVFNFCPWCGAKL